ncbi:hypothetical protein [Piscinibacter gummiphilus]|uniref:Uncharacterized protein n=1 Tax=Piscinibacter gummiphilus TaxID=946333 RepID=A0ABZ0CPV5_9BURK|nr:hypothetical protein [Piscinibacter gummiphilus]WOB06561.1 hypothetical protein RXV79_16705 [Piscinibacter gummiphilus]
MVLYHYCCMHLVDGIRVINGGSMTLDKAIETPEEYERARQCISAHVAPTHPGGVVLLTLNKLGGAE